MSGAFYDYRAVDKAGRGCAGVVRAACEQEAYRKVSAMSMTPVRLRPAKSESSKRGRARVSSKDIAHFTYQIGVLMQARIPISDGLRSIAEQEPNARFRALLLDVSAKIQSGSTITDAMETHRSVFGDVYIETFRAAERSGSLIKALEHLAEMLEQQAESRQQLRQALTYPLAVMTALGAACVFLVAFVVPKFASMFEKRGVDLPFLTRALQTLGVSIQQYWWVYAIGGVGVWLLWRHVMGTARGKAALDRFLHRVPYLNRVLIGLAVSRFMRVFGISLGAGLGLIESISMSGRASGRPLLMRDAERMVEQVRGGGRLSEALRQCEYLPGFARRMVAAGEESAELTRMCTVVARHYEREVSHMTKNSATIIEPVLVSVLTGVILVVALAIFLPMWDMVGLVG